MIGEEFKFTETNQFWIKFENEEKTKDAFKRLEDINISTNIIFLPKGQWGLRIGTNELTRLGMSNEYIDKLAELFKEAVIDKCDKNILLAKSKELARELSTINVKYSFDNTKEGIKLIKKITDRYDYMEVK